MTFRKMTELEIKLDSISEDVLEKVDDLGRQSNYGAEFREGVRNSFGSDFLDIYDERVEDSQWNGVPQ